MSPFSVPLSLSSSKSRQDSVCDRLDTPHTPLPHSESSPRSSDSSHTFSVLAGLARPPASPLVISTNLNHSSFSSSPSSPASPEVGSPPNAFAWPKPEDKAPLPWDLDESFAPSSPASIDSSCPLEDLLAPGDVVCHGGYLQSETIQIVPIPHSHQADVDQPLGEEFEVVRRLGAGSYAVVYLVREVLSRPWSDDGHSMLGHMDLDSSSECPSDTVYGREYAIKCLSKSNLEEGAMASQLTEATIHQSLRPHPNIVTLHRTFETSSFLLLLLEYVPGEDLYYFLSRARDRYEMDPVESSAVFTSCTPPTPGLLSTSNPSQLLSRSRLRLISSMFSQICDAVDVCHSNGVYHRDIKPENLIVTDSWVVSPSGERERKVAVKLSDFGLATTDVESSDMDCGSAPYMSYECRNNVSPYYRPRGADIWSLGIVLLNMLYHRNPWTDTTQGVCISFEHFRRRPVAFLMKRFTGMKRPVAEFLANRVFCTLDNPLDDSPRVTAKEFGQWAKDLPRLLLDRKGLIRAPRPVAINEEHPLSSFAPPSHRPSSRNSSISSTVRAPLTRGTSQTHMHILEPPLESITDDDIYSFYDPELDDPENDLAVNPMFASNAASRPFALATSIRTEKSASANAPPSPTSATTPTVSKKTSKWKLSFGKSSATTATLPATPVTPSKDSAPMSATASNVSNLIMGLNAPSPLSSHNEADRQSTWTKGRQPNQASRAANRKNQSTHESIQSSQFWSPQKSSIGSLSPNSMRSDPSLASSANSIASGNWRSSMSSTTSLATSNSAFTRFSNNSTRSVNTTATSVSSSSWRSGEGKGKTLSPFQKKTMSPQNSSTLPRNVKFIPGVPWELGQLPRSMQPKSDNLSNAGSPPLKQRTVLSNDIFGSPPINLQQRSSMKPKDSKLGTIVERPRSSSVSSSEDGGNPRSQDASTSTSDLEEDAQEDESSGRKKVQKGQINALAKMLSALRR